MYVRVLNAKLDTIPTSVKLAASKIEIHSVTSAIYFTSKIWLTFPKVKVPVYAKSNIRDGWFQ